METGHLLQQGHAGVGRGGYRLPRFRNERFGGTVGHQGHGARLEGVGHGLRRAVCGYLLAGDKKDGCATKKMILIV